MSNVFISYCHVKPDQDLAAELVRFLESRGIDVFIDAKIQLGQKWMDEIDRHLREARHFVVLLSLESIRSDMVRQEIKVVHDLRKTNWRNILPVRVGLAGELPYDIGSYLNSHQHAVWRPSQKFEPVCLAILESIENSTEAAGEEDENNPAPDITEPGAPTQGTEEIRSAPLPSAEPRLETGAVRLDSSFYVRRIADTSVSDVFSQRGVTVLIKGSRQVGKTSLLARAQALAAGKGHRTVYFDFQLIDSVHFQSLNSLLRYMAQRLARDLRTAIKPADFWDDWLGGPESFTTFFELAVLEVSTGDVTLSFDEADRVFEYPFRNEFFGMIRAWHNRRAINPLWTAVNLFIAHSTEPALFIDRINQSPFNVGEIIRLGDFTAGEVDGLNEMYGSPLRTSSEMREFTHLVGGHPFLSRQALYWLRTIKKTMADLARVADRDDGPFGDHLRRFLWMLRDRVDIRNALTQVLREGYCGDEVAWQRLCAAGLVKGEARGRAGMRYSIYRRYFASHL